MKSQLLQQTFQPFLNIIQDNLLRESPITADKWLIAADNQCKSAIISENQCFHEVKKMISLPQKPKVIKKDKNKAVFEIEALYPGYGITIGNSLRRALLSSLSGAAITEVKIKDVPHEFSTIKGVLEDVILILLNLKKVRFKTYSDEPQTGTLKVSGEKEVKADNFKLPPQLEIINKDLHIATLTDKKASLEMEIKIEKGVGYEPVETKKKPFAHTREKLEIGTIALDAIYTPIKNVAFRVENMRVGERTDYDKLILEIETDGTLTPEMAFSQACKILLDHFSLLETEMAKSLTKKSDEEKRVKKAMPLKILKTKEKKKKKPEKKKVKKVSPKKKTKAKEPKPKSKKTKVGKVKKKKK